MSLVMSRSFLDTLRLFRHVIIKHWVVLTLRILPFWFLFPIRRVVICCLSINHKVLKPSILINLKSGRFNLLILMIKFVSSFQLLVVYVYPFLRCLHFPFIYNVLEFSVNHIHPGYLLCHIILLSFIAWGFLFSTLSDIKERLGVAEG